ncbi:RNA-directed DNA polymerase, eukaryota, reverse transcriptase zinc-binding domain protein [Tanacetum coccineum]
MIDRAWVSSPHQVKEAFLTFFKEKFSNQHNLVTFPTLTPSSVLSEADIMTLEGGFTLDEIRAAVWGCGGNKAPGRDGFSFIFLKTYWDLFSYDIAEFVMKFFDSCLMPTGANSSFITLIPKVTNPLHITDYRPISLIGVHYKIIAKLLASRLSLVIHKIVSKEQSAFIVGRQILDGLLMLSEVIDWYKKWNKKLMIFKVNFEKAFDSVINGSPSSEFSIYRGLRQGDPLSPFLFILVMEGLYLALKDALHSNLFMEQRLAILVSDISRVTRCAAGSMPYTYLGLPIGSNMSRIANWKKLVDMFRSKIWLWKANLLSIEGLLTLIKAVLGSIGIYYMSIFKVSESIIKLLERFRALFFWGGNKDRKKLSWIKWVNVLASLDKGGLGVGSLKAFNFALLQKWHWRLVHNPLALWVQMVKVIHGSEGGYDEKGCNTRGLWSKIVDSSNYLHYNGIIPMSTLRFKVGCGSNVRLWKDTWLRDGSLNRCYNQLFRLDRNEDCCIIDRISNGEWSWDWDRHDLGGRNADTLNLLLAKIGNANVGTSEDSWHWNLSDDGQEIVCYESPRPSMGIHRMVFVLFRQLGRQTVYAPGWRQNFNTKDFAELYNLGSPVAAVYFNCQRESGFGGRRR